MGGVGSMGACVELVLLVKFDVDDVGGVGP